MRVPLDTPSPALLFCPYSPKCVEGEFSEVRPKGILGSLPHEKMHIVTMPVGKGAEE